MARVWVLSGSAIRYRAWLISTSVRDRPSASPVCPPRLGHIVANPRLLGGLVHALIGRRCGCGHAIWPTGADRRRLAFVQPVRGRALLSGLRGSPVSAAERTQSAIASASRGE